ncbi:hypothetical protein WK09_28165 [Burkholderia ubonensis]|uniref:transglycosylase SLT domain-containing protein n=1 Tax=Burkholderia ubonensis TaxID=101571 RepID=UPI00075236AC|nr:transglycosylase SLT domain-containing protein [Burkholderia ubonensis]KVR05342.1 hypothetical protein WK09_28165 [Burkholderia ubonensis]KWB97441.1 hypothetical protein WL43_30065 [Burkholderia ubonensis]
MTIKTDSKGFLIADGPVDTASMAHGIEAVHSDTSAILSLLRGGAHAASIMKRQRVSTPPRAMNAVVQRATSGVVTSAVRSALVQSRTRDAQGRFIPNAPGELPVITKAVNAMTRKQAADKAAQKRSEATAAAASVKAVEQARDKSGRFVGRGGSRGEGGGGDSALRNTFSRLKDLFPRRSAPDLRDYEKIDPTVEAAKEVSKIVGGPLVPIGKLTKAGASRAFGIGKDPSLPWFRKIFNVLKQSHDDQGEFALTQTRILKEIDNKTGGGRVSAGGGILGGIGSMLTGRSGGLLSSLFSGALSLGKKGLRRIPLLGALFAGSSALASIFGGDDPNKTAEQNRQDRFTGAGSGIGALIGGGIGTLVGGPVGTMIGGVLGDKLGEIVGGWLATVDWSKVGAQISDTWNSAVGTLKDDWKAVTDKLSSITKTIGDTWDALLSGAKAFLKDKFGIDVDALAKKVSDVAKPAVDAAKAGVDAVKDAGKAAVDYAKGRAEKMAQPISTATKNVVAAGQGVLEDLIPGYRHSANFDGVKGGAALSKYGSYTNDEANQIRQLKASGANTSANLKGGMPVDVQAKIVAAATKEGLDPKTMLEFASIESGGNANAISNTGAIGIFQFTGKTASGVGIKNRFDVDQNIAGGMKLAKQNAAVLSRAGLAVTPENLYMMHQLGPGAAKEIIKGAANGKNISDLSANTQKAVALNYGKGSKTAADYLSANATALQSRYDTVVGSGIPVPVVATAAATPATPATPPIVPVAPVPAMPAAPLAQTAQIPVPLNSDKPLEVRVADDRAVGQDLQNRRLAQIATGGLSG